jgi:hypothetical protein
MAQVALLHEKTKSVFAFSVFTEAYVPKNAPVVSILQIFL